MSEEAERISKIPNLYLNKKLCELAGMFKEHHSGSSKMFKKIKARYSLQEGVASETATKHTQILIDAGLLSVYKGSGRWRYNAKEEWDLFTVTIDTKGHNGGE